MKADLEFLAGDALRGRLTGTAESALAARFIEARFGRLGLKPLGNGFSQRFSLVESFFSDGNQLTVTADGVGVTAKSREDFYPLIFSASASATGQLLFAGYGIVAPQFGWDDLRGGSIPGSVLLVLDDEPGADDPASVFDGVVSSEPSRPLRKALAAQERGAIGLLIVNPRQRQGATRTFADAARAYWPPRPPRITRYTLASLDERVRIPVAQISPAIADSLLRPGRLDLASAARNAAAAGGATPVVLGSAKAELRTSLSRKTIDDFNVIAVVEGADARLKDEAVLVTAHYDHNGADEQQIFNGADDNGSGAVALLDIAEAYTIAAQRGERPRRTVIFAAWGAEERCCGPLLGSWAWTEHPLWPLDKTVAVLNMDMIGRSEEVPEGGGPRFNGLRVQTAASNASAVNLIGYSYSPDLVDVVKNANSAYDLVLRQRYDNNRSNLLRRSDQWPFLQRGVPALWFHTGLHPDYHTQFDRPEKIDYAKMERIARLVHQASWNLAQADSRPRFAEKRTLPGPD